MIDKGIECLRRGLSLCTGANLRKFEPEIQAQILKANKIRFYKNEELQKQEKAQLLYQLEGSLKETQNPDVQRMYERFADYLGNEECQCEPQQKGGDASKSKVREIPDYLRCPISDDLMEDPVLIESGNTYERSMIEQHFKTNGYFDPVSRQNVNPDFIYPNRNLKKASEDFVAKN